MIGESPRFAGGFFRRHHRMLLRVHVAPVPVIVAVCAYGALTLWLPAEVLRPLVIGASLVGGLAFAAQEYFVRRSIPTFLGIVRGKVPAGREQLLAVASEASRLPDLLLRLQPLTWLGCGLGCGAVVIAFAAEPERAPGMVRFGVIGGAFGAFAGVLGYLFGIRWSRALIEELASLGVERSAIRAQLPPGRMRLRNRLVVFVCALLLLPTLFSANLAMRIADQHVSGMKQAPTVEARRAQSAEVYRDILVSAGAVGAIFIALAAWVAFVAGGVITAPLGRMASRAKRMAGGELEDAELIAAEDDVWALAASFARVRGEIGAAVKQLHHVGAALDHTAVALVNAASSQTAGSSEQQVSLNMTSATTEELARSAKQISENALEVTTLAGQMLDSARLGQQKSSSFLNAMGQMRERNHAIADAVVRLNKRVQQVGRVVEFINEVADKSDLLALNAELEGTKAGEVGRGFSLVAAEMRRLAESVLGSTREIATLIHEIRDATHAAVMATEAGVKATDRGAAVAEQVSASLRAVVELAHDTAGSVQSITLATGQQQTGTDQLALAMANLLEVTRAGTALGERQALSSERLAGLSLTLRDTVARFKLEQTP